MRNLIFMCNNIKIEKKTNHLEICSMYSILTFEKVLNTYSFKEL